MASVSSMARIDLPWGARHHLCRLEEATRDEPSNHPRPDAEPIGGLVQREQGRRAGLVVVDEAQPLSERVHARGRPRVAGSCAQAKPVEAGGDVVIRPGARHAPHDALGVRASPVAVIARHRSWHPHLGVSASHPVDHQDDLARVIIGIGNDLLDQQARDPLLESHLAARRLPHPGQIRGQRFERVSIDGRHGSRRAASLRRQSAFELGDPLERRVPSRLELRGHQTIVGVDGFIAPGGERRVVRGLFQLQRERAVLGVVVLLREIPGLDRGHAARCLAPRSGSRRSPSHPAVGR